MTPPPPGYRPPPSSYDFPPDRGAPPRAYGLPSPVHGSPPAYRPQTDYGPPPEYGPRRQGLMHHLHTESRIPPRRHAPTCDLQWRCGPWECGWQRVCYPGVYAKTQPRLCTAPRSRTTTVRVEVTSPLDPARLAAIPTQGAHQTVTAVTRESSESRATTELLRSASWQSGCRLARSYRGISCRQGRSCTTAEDDPDRPLGPPSALGLIEHRYRLISRRPPLGSTRQWGHLQPPQTA